MTARKSKKITTFLTAFAVLFTMLAGTVQVQAAEAAKTIALSIDNPIMTVDGTEMEIDPGNGTSPIVISGRTLLPARAVLEAMGDTAEWDNASKTATLRHGTNEMQLAIGRVAAVVNGEEKSLDVAPVVQNGRTMLPMRFIAENFGFDVDWSRETRTVTITAADSAPNETAETTAKIGSDPMQTTTEKNVPMLKLNNGLSIPQLGIGTFSLSEEQAYTSVLSALQNGYRHIDTAHAYGNERSVGRAIKDSGVPREEIWVTSKIWPSEYGEKLTPEAIDKMLDRLGLEYLDLVYLHQPVGDVKGAWKALEQCVKEGKIRSLGLSNFDPAEAPFDEMLAEAEIKPVIMQIECHPLAQRRDWQEKLRENDMVFESWFPLGGRTEGGASLREDPTLQAIAEAHGKSAVQVILRWHVQEGFSVVPGSSNPAHIAENIDIFDFELTDEEMETIRNMNKDQRFFDLTFEQVQQFIAGTPVED